MDGVPLATNPGRRAARAGLRHNRGLLLGQRLEESLGARGDGLRASLRPVVAAAAAAVLQTHVGFPAAVARSSTAAVAAAAGTVAARAAAVELAAAAAGDARAGRGEEDFAAAAEVLRLAVEALRGAAALSPHFDSLTEVGAASVARSL